MTTGIQGVDTDNTPEKPPDPNRSKPSTRILDGWAALREWTHGIDPAEIPALARVRGLEPVYFLFRFLTGENPRDWLARAGVIEHLIANMKDQSTITSVQLEALVQWLDDEGRRRTLNALKDSGWLERTPDGAWRLTPASLWAYQVLDFLHKQVGEGDVLATVESVEAAIALGLDPVSQLEAMRLSLLTARDRLDIALTSRSDVVMEEEARRLGDVQSLLKRVRRLYDAVPKENAAAQTVLLDIHDLVSRLAQRAADLQMGAAIVGRQKFHITEGRTLLELYARLRHAATSVLADLATRSLTTIQRAPTLLSTESLLTDLRIQLDRRHARPEAQTWTAPTAIQPAIVQPRVHPLVLALITDLESATQARDPTPLEDILVRSTAQQSFMRAALLAVAEERVQGEGIATRLGRIPILVSADGMLKPLARRPIHRITTGTIHKRRMP